MAIVHVTDAQGAKHEIDAPSGETLMQVMVDAGVEGILADCGGGCACATCHCYIEGNGMSVVGEVNIIEDNMLDNTEAPRKENSRLSCQIDITDEMDGLNVTVPAA